MVTNGYQDQIINLKPAHIVTQENGILNVMINKIRAWLLKKKSSKIPNLKYTRKRSLKVDLILDRIDKIKGS